MSFINPVLGGSYPDPSLCRVGNDYYLVTSSFQYFPGVPIFHSQDLVHWKQIGHCLTRPSQLNFKKYKNENYIFAATLRYDKGIFYMTTTDVYGGGNFFVTARDPAGPWSDPVWIDSELFDPSLFFDEDETVYYTRRGKTGIVQAEIDINRGKLKTKPREITRGFCSPDIEGPHLYKIGGWYYLLSAEGGSRYGHMATIGRSKSPWGPFQGAPHNPILTHRHLTSSPIRDTGHGEIIQAPEGSWWMFFLGTRHYTYDSFSHLGRETFLAPLIWRDDGWPVVGQSGTISLVIQGMGSSIINEQKIKDHDDFNSKELALHWNFIRIPEKGSRSLTEHPGSLRLWGNEVSLDDLDAPVFVGRRQTQFDTCTQTLLDFSPKGSGEEAGLAVYMNHLHHYEIGIKKGEEKRVIFVCRRLGDLCSVVAEEEIPAGPVWLQITSEAMKYTFSYKTSKTSSYKTLQSALTRYLSAEVAESWTGVYLGMYATGNGKKSSTPADFDWFEYREESLLPPSILSDKDNCVF